MIILWENIGVSMMEKVKNNIFVYGIMVMCLIFSYLGHYYW